MNTKDVGINKSVELYVKYLKDHIDTEKLNVLEKSIVRTEIESNIRINENKHINRK